MPPKKTIVKSCMSCQIVRFDKSLCGNCPMRYGLDGLNLNQKDIANAISQAAPVLPLTLENYLARVAEKFSVVRSSKLNEMAGHDPAVYGAAIKRAQELGIEIRKD